MSEEREGPEPGWILKLVYLSLLPLESSGKRRAEASGHLEAFPHGEHS